MEKFLNRNDYLEIVTPILSGEIPFFDHSHYFGLMYDKHIGTNPNYEQNLNLAFHAYIDALPNATEKHLSYLRQILYKWEEYNRSKWKEPRKEMDNQGAAVYLKLLKENTALTDYSRPLLLSVLELALKAKKETEKHAELTLKANQNNAIPDLYGGGGELRFFLETQTNYIEIINLINKIEAHLAPINETIEFSEEFVFAKYNRLPLSELNWLPSKLKTEYLNSSYNSSEGLFSYLTFSDYHFIKFQEFIPVYQIAKDILLNAAFLKKLFTFDHLETYKQGFLKGYRNDFKPFVDLPENRMTLILSELNKPIKTIPVKHKVINKNRVQFIDKSDLFQYSISVGKRYKAWSIVLENPEVFEATLKEAEQKESKPTTKLSIPEIALIYVYENKVVNRENAKEIVKQYGWSSGDDLYNNFGHYSSNANRKAIPETRKKLENKIKKLENILNHLSPKAKVKATTELNDFKLVLEAEY